MVGVSSLCVFRGFDCSFEDALCVLIAWSSYGALCLECVSVAVCFDLLLRDRHCVSDT